MSKVHLGDGRHVDTKELVETIRAFRGRLTRREICAALGCPNRTARRVVSRLCQDYQIATVRPNKQASVPPLPPGRNSAEVERQIELQDAKRQLAHEIAAYQQQVDSGVGLRAYKPGPLEW